MFSIIIVCLMLLLVIPGIKIKGTPSGIEKEETVAIKGVLCLMIFLHHFSGWFSNLDPIMYFLNHCGGFMVSVFFFLSAYGLSKSEKTKKQTVKSLFLRILKIFIPFWISDTICLSVYYFMKSSPVELSAKTVLLSFVNLSGIVQYSWFVSAIVFLYVVYFLLSKVKKMNLYYVLFFGILIASSFVVPTLWLTYFVFPVGLIISRNESFMASLSKWKCAIILIVDVMLIGAGVVLKYLSEIDSYMSGMSDALSAVGFVVLVYMIVRRIHIGNKVLSFLGKISYEVYLLHGLGIFIAGKFFSAQEPYVFLLVALTFTIIASFVVNSVCKVIFKRLPKGS